MIYNKFVFVALMVIWKINTGKKDIDHTEIDKNNAPAAKQKSRETRQQLTYSFTAPLHRCSPLGDLWFPAQCLGVAHLWDETGAQHQ